MVGVAEQLNDKLFVESVIMLGLSIVGLLSVLGNPSLARVYIYKVVSLLSFLMCGGYMLFTMFIIILRNLVNSGALKGRVQQEDGFNVMLTYTIYFVSTLSLLGAAVSSNALYSSLEAQEEILKLIRFTIGPA